MISASSARALSDAQARDLWEKYLEERITSQVVEGRSSVIFTDNFYLARDSGTNPPAGALALWANIDTVCSDLRKLGYTVDLRTRTPSRLLGGHIADYRCLQISW